MAQVIQKTHALEAQRQRYASNRNVLWAIGGVILVAAMTLSACSRGMSPLIAVSAVLWFGSVIVLGIGGAFHNKVRALGSGLKGEMALASVVAALPESFVGFQNVTAEYEGKTSEIDMVIVGPTGVFAVEVKNHNGRIFGDTSQPQWIQHKIGQKGTPYTAQLYSPVKQVGTHVYRLANRMRTSGFRTYVQGAVLFANPATPVQVTGDIAKIPVFAAYNGGETMLCRYILERPITLQPQEIAQLSAFLGSM